MKKVETQKQWLFSLVGENQSMEDIVKGYIWHYALNDMNVCDVERDFLQCMQYSPEQCEYAMQTLKTALQWYVDREESRTLTEAQAIVEAVREGVPVQISYYDPEVDDDPYVQRKCW